MKKVKLGDHIVVVSGFAFDSNLFNDDGVGLPLVRIRDVGKESSGTFYSGEFRSDFVLEKGDLLVGMDGEFRLAEWSGGKALLNQRVCKIVPKSGAFVKEYLKYVLPAELKKIEDKTPFVTVKHLSVKGIQNIEIPFPPLSEQKRIASLLDAADHLRQQDKALIGEYNLLAQSVFLEMFGDPVRNERGWEVKELDSFLLDIVSGFSANSEPREKTSDEWGVLKISAVTRGYFDANEYKAVSTETVANKKLITPRKGDLLFSRANTRELVGATCVVDADYPDLFLPDKLWRIDLDSTQATNQYLRFLLSHEEFRSSLTKTATGTSGSMLNISMSKLRQLECPVPPLSLQQKFAEVIGNIELQKGLAERNLAESEALFAGLLQGGGKG